MDKIDIDLVPINDLLDKNFFIPSYQRGYRWTPQQVTDLLEDIKEFMDNGANGIYCIQPLVVKGIPQENAVQAIGSLYANNATPKLDEIREKLNVEKWEVIDGQQRLTTIKILLSYLYLSLKGGESKSDEPNSDKPKSYELEYETRKKDESSNDEIKKYIGSSDFLAGLGKDNLEYEGKEFNIRNVADSNIDFYHMKSAYDTIKKWFDGYKNDKEEDVPPVFDGDKETFLNVLKDKVQFIWYETKETDPIKVFTRLNIGKIALTDAELIKALFLNQSNFKSENKDAIRLQQIEIANEWDRIEYTLQNDEFWLFIQNNTDYKNPTRIDFIFDIIREKNVLGYMGDCGNDEHQTFRYFYQYFKTSKQNIDAEWLRKTWLTVKNYFQIFEEWYNDLELYHYVGFLIERGVKLEALIKDWNGTKEKAPKSSKETTEGENVTKETFKRGLIDKIKEKISGCKDLNRSYGESGEKKTECFPLLLLYNIQYVINQNRELAKSEKYGMGAFYKFPFNLFKKEGKKKNGKGWEVEHIASNSGDNLETVENQKMWLSAVLYALGEGKLKTHIENFLDSPKPATDFASIKQDIDKLDLNPIKGEDKQKIWNYALLDSSTNEEYQNDPFPIKRICVVAKEHGHKAKVTFDEQNNRVKIDKSEPAIAFVPPCTKNVFMKAYTDVPNSLSAWSKNDAEAYLKDIERTLLEFLYPAIYEISIEKTPALANRIICQISKDVLDRYIKIVKYALKTKQENNNGKQ